MTTTDDIKREALERAQAQIGDMLPDCVLFRRGEYAGFDVETATKAVAAALLRARADEAARAARSTENGNRIYFAPRVIESDLRDRAAELRTAANEIERGE